MPKPSAPYMAPVPFPQRTYWSTSFIFKTTQLARKNTDHQNFPHKARLEGWRLTVVSDVARVVTVVHGDLRRIPNAFTLEHAHVELQADQRKDRQDKAGEDHDISQANDRLEQRVNDCFQALSRERFLKTCGISLILLLVLRITWNYSDCFESSQDSQRPQYRQISERVDEYCDIAFWSRWGNLNRENVWLKPGKWMGLTLKGSQWNPASSKDPWGTRTCREWILEPRFSWPPLWCKWMWTRIFEIEEPKAQ